VRSNTSNSLSRVARSLAHLLAFADGPDVGRSIFGDGTPNSGVWAALNNNSTISGVGITMEGIWYDRPTNQPSHP